ncbi:SDR family NAD(P)-dependent oxidoreductase [Streptomyces sp. NPDC047097]|uniref:SDR family NAD(P)-dependent oxidoreductase n=1 Tax=Streptomyces sp. NPDC047097 TaxID=3155260 RepID=UPI0033E0557C
MLPAGKTAIVHGGSGAVGAAVARAFAREGAAVHLTGRTLPPLDDTARRIRDAGGVAHAARLDATDRAAADRHADEGALLAERPAYEDVANAAVFAASDRARTMTATELDLTGGLVPD